MAEHGSEFALERNSRRVRKARDLFRSQNILLQGEARAVHHHGLVAEVDGFLNDRLVIHLDIVLVDDGDMIQVQARESFILDPLVLLVDGSNTSGVELHPLRPRHGDEAETIRFSQRLDNHFHHGQKRDVKGRDHGPRSSSVPHAGTGVEQLHRISTTGLRKARVILGRGSLRVKQ